RISILFQVGARWPGFCVYSHSTQDLNQSILKAIQKAKKPLSVTQTRDELPTQIRPSVEAVYQALDELQNHGEIHHWPSRSRAGAFWNCSAEGFACEKILECAIKPVSRTSLKAEASRKTPGFTQAKIDSLITKLRSEGKIFIHPPVGRFRQRYAASPPDPTPYLDGIVRNLEDKAIQLARCGVERDEVIKTFASKIGSSGAKSPNEEQSLAKTLLKILNLVSHRPVVSVVELKKLIGKQKTDFDTAILELSNSGLVKLHVIDDPQNLGEDALYDCVKGDAGIFYGGVSLR
ncbi:MAG: hypothetical protein P1V20_08435, partial [Verrucomicrobiales bacterium]|nr:hypothetical protein [Verrucomicrobiales bacterium]